MSDDTDLIFNGINGATGNYLLPAMTPSEIAKIAQGDIVNSTHLRELKHRHDMQTDVHLGVREGVDATKLDEAGWGVIFAHADGPRIEEQREALRPLLELRQQQSGERYHEYIGADAYRPGESKSKFLARHGMGPGAADPDKVPYYLMIVADPSTIPFRIQYQLDVDYAVGRVHFDNLEEYETYAISVVEAEQGMNKRSRELSFFGVQNAADRATAMSTKHLVTPLAQKLRDTQPTWEISTRLKDKATKADLKSVLCADDGPALLFTASHGMGFPSGDPRQLMHQGALLCQDWPGPLQWHEAISPDHYFSVDDLDGVNVAGLIAFHFACYGAGTPQLDDFAHRALQERVDIAPRPFVAKLPKGLLSHANGSALAVVGHVERAWGYSFIWPGAGEQIAAFEDAIVRLVNGHPIGSAMEYFDDRYASISTELNDELEEIKFGKTPDDLQLAGMWTANNDARSYVIVGDPAVRLAIC